MAYTIIEPQSGLLPIASTDAGALPPNGATVYPTPPMYGGMAVSYTHLTLPTNREV